MPRDNSDNSKVESLVKILRREQATGFRDSAVIGGWTASSNRPRRSWSLFSGR